MKISLVLLAAGSGSRFGKSKLEAKINNRLMIEYILSSIPIDAFSHVTIVAANTNILEIAKAYKINGIINSEPSQGISKSIRMGTEIIRDTDACMYCVSDQPLLSKSTMLDMLNSYKKNTILSLTCNGQRGNPVIFPSFLYDELMMLNGHEPGQKVINNHLDILKLHEITDNTQLMDIDTKEDYEMIKKIINKEPS